MASKNTTTEVMEVDPVSPLLIAPSLDLKIPAITLTATGVRDALQRGLADIKNKHALVSVVVQPVPEKTQAPQQTKDAIEPATEPVTSQPVKQDEARKQPYDGLLMRKKQGRTDFGTRARMVKREVHPLIPKKYLQDSAWRDTPVFDDSDDEDSEVD